MAEIVRERAREVLEVVYASMMETPCERALAERYGITIDRFLDDYASALVVGVRVQGEMAGGIYFDGDEEVHIGILRRFRGRWVRALPGMLEVGFRAFGPRLIARVNRENALAQRFVERIGGARAGWNEMTIDYVLRRERMAL